MSTGKLKTKIKAATPPQSHPTQPIEVSVQDIPADDSCTFLDSGTPLPSPDEVRARAEQEGIDTRKCFRPDPVRFPERGLIVKWGMDVTIAEGQCFWFISRHLQEFVPVPRIFGWKRDGTQMFLYLELIEGDTLASRWDGLETIEKTVICEQLRGMIASWRRIVKPPNSGIQLSQIGDQPLRDIMFSDAGNYPAGPFPNVGVFHDYFAGLISRHGRTRQEIEELAGLADDTPTTFTHADLHQSNILVSKTGDGPFRILAIIDWHQSGWYPEPWELLKARCVGVPDSDWVKDYLPTVLDEPKFAYYYAWEYMSMALI